MKAWSLHRWIVAAMLAVLIVSLSLWWTSRDRLPGRIRIATAEPGGLYHRASVHLAESLRAGTGREVELISTRGSVENHELLVGGEVELAILQSTAVPLRDVAVLAPLYREVVHVVVENASGIRTIADIPGHRVSLGPEGSGMRESALELLAHYRVDVSEIEDDGLYFMGLESGALEGAIVTTGIENPDLERLLATGDYRLLPIRDAEAISLRRPLFSPFVIPRGLFDERPAVPPDPLPTVASTAVLAAAEDCGDALVEAALDAVYAEDMRARLTTLVHERDAMAMAPAPLHDASRRYLDPYGGIDVLSQTIEALSGAKELLFGLAALCYLTWDLARSRRRRIRRREVQALKDRLDEYLARTVTIERAQMATDDPEELKRHLVDVTELKLEAIEELTHEDLRGDRMFLIFLTQCANLIRKIQTKILAARRPDVAGAPGEPDPTRP